MTPDTTLGGSIEPWPERGEAPVARAASPLWKWAFIGLLTLVGAGGLAAVLVAELREPAPATEDGARPRLRFDAGEFDVPAFPPPEPAPTAEVSAIPAPPPPTEPALDAAELLLPELPPPEPRHGPLSGEPPAPVPAAPVSPAERVETPEELAAKRRLSTPLSGSGGSSAGPSSAGEGDERERAGLDLTVTRTSTALARRLSDLTFILPKGSYLNCILDTAIQSDQAGLISCTLPEDVYGADGTVVLLDRGSQVLGEYRSASLTYGKRRIFVVWDRVRTPAGVIVDIASPGTGPLGQAGLGGHIDQHYWERVGIPVLMSAVSFGAESYTREALTPDQANFIQDTADDTLSGVLGELARIKPTLHKNQGEPISILVARDLDLSPVYELRGQHGG
jgi:type IV secretion system protein VirB10